MATTTASITISSGDLTGDALSLSSTATFTKHNSSTGLDQTTGVARKFLAGDAASAVKYTLLTASDYTEDSANKVYIKNLSSSNSEYLTVMLGGTGGAEIGRLYGGDWMFIPWTADVDSTPDRDIVVETPSGTVNQNVEYLLIYHS
jgi:hypothetical protein